jgi:hypothetical protein
MTKSQIWVATFLVLFLILFGLNQLTKNDNQSTGIGNETGISSKNEPKEFTGLELIKSNGCTSCHGAELKGTNLAPNLIGIKQYWSGRESLINYLRNPSSFMDKNRFLAYKEKYSSVVMPPFNNLDVKDLGKIADYLRGL